jgi:hypothetical protein
MRLRSTLTMANSPATKKALTRMRTRTASSPTRLLMRPPHDRHRWWGGGSKAKCCALSTRRTRLDCKVEEARRWVCRVPLGKSISADRYSTRRCRGVVVMSSAPSPPTMAVSLTK